MDVGGVLALRLDGLLSEAGGTHRPLTTCVCTFLEPLPSVAGGAHRPLTTESPCSPVLAYPYPPTHPSFPLVVKTKAPGLSLFHCSVSGPHRGGHLPSPLARCVHPIPAVGEPFPMAAVPNVGGGGARADVGCWMLVVFGFDYGCIAGEETVKQPHPLGWMHWYPK